MLPAVKRRAFLLAAAAGMMAATAKCAALSVPSVSSLFGAESQAELPDLCTGKVMSVCGPISPSKMGVTLPHEHVVCDFRGAENGGGIGYDMEVAFKQILPSLVALRAAGCQTLVDCTPAYVGRNVKFLARLSKASELNILTNTGYYGAQSNRYIPPATFNESAEDLAFRWMREAWYGIGETGIRPGFIKIGVDAGGLSGFQGKLFQAAGKAHLQTGLPIMVHASDGIAVAEGLSLLRKEGVDAEALIWAHANSATDEDRIEQARLGAWICLDGVRKEGVEAQVKMLKRLKKEDLLDRVLLSHDHYWEVKEGGTLSPVGESPMYLPLFNTLLPQLKAADFDRSEIRKMVEKNPQEAFEIGVRKGNKARKKYLLF